MTEEEHSHEGDGEEIEDLEAPAEAAEDVAGGICTNATNACRPAGSVVHCPYGVTQLCDAPTCKVTTVMEQEQ
ncbi:MAG TPA: hypothetical protein VGG08_04525 [Solirubrobacteraceae bacterium]|jgi:hypothetical protein